MQKRGINMALYVYKCDFCDREYHFFVSMDKRDEVVFYCPECHIKLKRKVSTGVNFNIKDVSKFYDRKRYGR